MASALEHEWPVILDAVSRIIEAVAVIIAALYARHGARLAKRTARMLGTLPQSFARRRRRPADDDPKMDALKAEADDKLAEYLNARHRLDQYADRPRESRHR